MDYMDDRDERDGMDTNNEIYVYLSLLNLTGTLAYAG